MAYQEEQEAPSTAPEEEKILAESRRELKECIDEDQGERTKMRDDLRFMALDQWPTEIRQERENDVENGPRPCLTIDKVNQYRNQVVNDLRQGKPGINVRPQDDAADVETARILKGLVRNIEDQSNADIAYMTGAGSAVDIGLGYFRIVADYVSEDSFEQELFIRPITNTFSTYLGKHMLPDGSDSEVAFIAESMPNAKFRELYPKAKADSKDFEGLDTDIIGHWITNETVTVVEKYCFKRLREELYFLKDGTTMPKAMYDKWPESAGEKPGIADKRVTYRKQLKWYKMTGVEILEERDLPGKYIPVVEVVGREAWVDGKRYTWGIVRPAKDSLRMYNYWASTITERMALAPKVPYVGAKGQFEGLEDRWRKANRVNYAYLEYNPTDVNGTPLPAPQRQGPTPVEAALLQQMQVIEHDVQASLGIFKAGVGESESQQSGRAILALQRESDTGTYHFGANLGVSIRHAGRILVDLIPYYYDTKRIVRILGEDGEVQTATLDPDLDVAYKNTAQGALFNPTMGKYDVSITVGPSYNTKRMEAAAVFTELSKGAADPISAAVMRYLTVRHSDFTGSDEAAKMLKALLPPAIQQAASGQQQLPPEAVAAVAQAQQGVQVMKQQMAEMGEENMKLKSGAQAKAMQTQADHNVKIKELDLEREVEKEKATLAREKADAEFDLKKRIASHAAELDEDKHKRECDMMERKMKFEQEMRSADEEHKRMEQAKSDEATAMPNFMKAFEQIVKVVQQIVEDNQKFQQQIVAQMQNPPRRTITLGSVKRGAEGITGATATVN